MTNKDEKYDGKNKMRQQNKKSIISHHKCAHIYLYKIMESKVLCLENMWSMMKEHHSTCNIRNAHLNVLVHILSFHENSLSNDCNFSIQNQLSSFHELEFQKAKTIANTIIALLWQFFLRSVLIHSK